MKTLLLVRHAKSSWSDPTLPDRIRPLAGRGRHDVEKMGKRLASRGVKPDLVLSSPAVRTAETAKALGKSLGYKHRNITVNDRLYACQPGDILEVVKDFDDGLSYVMLVGHNPEITDFVHLFTDRVAYMPTCATLELQFDVEAWADIARENLHQALYDSPKNEHPVA
ncbi:histidine phosphatase family protein [Advenella alkanexedens]|uniref:Histidine phosphatase family protein n=1 Tax=Advenella alkanexedens TaxID=1481665 RepID=A0ABS6NKF9_9BURK|nr:histidine phosphatase family protein [Advenella alkanexedens]MBV4395732.1 histidine phosphatase family protein [Advenella alkanexedens]